MRELNALIQRMVALDPTQRPADIQAVRVELQHIQQLNARANQQNHVWTPPQGQTPPAAGSGQQHIFLNPPVAQQQQARKTTRRAVLTTALVLGGVAALGGIIAQAGQSQSQQISRVDPNQMELLPLDGLMSWSSDMNYAAVANLMRGQIEIYKVQGQQLIQTIKNPANFSNPTLWWSSDNSKILAQTDSGTIYAWNVANGTQLFAITSLMAGYRSSDPVFVDNSPDGQIWAISYNDGNGNTNFTLLRASDGKQLFQKLLSNPAHANPSNNKSQWQFSCYS